MRQVELALLVRRLINIVGSISGLIVFVTGSWRSLIISIMILLIILVGYLILDNYLERRW